MDKTIKQVADEVGVSKQAIRKRIEKLPTDYYYVGANNTIYIKPKGLKIICEEAPTKSTKLDTKFDTKLVDTLQRQLEEKDRQLQAKDEQISSLLKSLDQAQQLQAIAETKLQAIEDKQTEPAGRKWFWRK